MTPPLIQYANKGKLKNNTNEDEQQLTKESTEELDQVKRAYYDLVLCNILTLCMVFLFLAVSLFLFRNHDEIFIQSMSSKVISISDYCTNISHEMRFDCHPENGASELSCQSRGCCWQPIDKKRLIQGDKVPLNTPYCFYPSNFKLYKYRRFTQIGNDFTGDLDNTDASAYKHDIQKIRMNSVSIDENILRVKIYDPTEKRFEPPWPIRDDPAPFTNEIPFAKYKFEMDKSKPGFRVKRGGEREIVLFDSLGAGGFIFADQLLQVSTILPSHNIYGLGEHRTNLKLNTNWQSFTMFNKDQPPTESANLYGSHPFYMVMEESGHCHGVLFLNSNAMDVILQPTPGLTFRSIGGIFDIYFFMGPTPADVLKQYSNIIGKPFMPPYWSLGFHLCRFGYKSLTETMRVWNRTRQAEIPFDTQWNDLDYMNNRNDFTYNNETFKGLPDFVDLLHKKGMHYIPLIDPGISASEKAGSYPPFDAGLQRNIFIKDSDSDRPFTGKVWNRVSTVWPDFTNPNTTEYWYEMMSNMYEEFRYDGAWIDMNEPSNFYNGKINGCDFNTLDNPPYVPNIVGNVLATKTVCMNAKHYLGSHYNIHNLYGISEALATNRALSKLRGKRPFIVSRATWVGQGAYSAHWTGDIYSSWHDLRMSVPEILSFSLFQIPMVGADICGFDGNTTIPLCNRWMQLGAFYPFSRNHNSDENIEQDPVAMGPLVIESSKRALTIRYRFLPYLYTLFYRAHKFGETVARPLFIEFPEDRRTWDIDSQFLWGSAFMIVPIFEENPESVELYLPRGIWYDLQVTSNSSINSSGEKFRIPAHDVVMPIFLRGGFIFPTQDPAATTILSRENGFRLCIAPDLLGKATGELYWDDGDSIDSIEKQKYWWIHFTYQNQTLTIDNITPGFYQASIVLRYVDILGVSKIPTKVLLDNQDVDFAYEHTLLIMEIYHLQIDLKKNFTLIWY